MPAAASPNEVLAKTYLKTYGAAIRAYLKEHNMHETILGLKVGCSGQQIRNIMGGHCAPSFLLSAAILKETGIRPME